MKTTSNRTNWFRRLIRRIERKTGSLRGVPFVPSFCGYDVGVCHEKKFVWFAVAKAATRTVSHHFRNHGLDVQVEQPSTDPYPPEFFREYFKFALVRNPLDRLVSCWINKVVDRNMYRFDAKTLVRMQEFENFVDYVAKLDIEKCDRHLRAQSALADMEQIDFLGRVETFDRDFQEVCNKLDIPCREVVSRNVSKDRKPFEKYYTASAREKALQIYAKDMETFGYEG